MFSIQKILGREEKFYDLLEGSAQQADASVHHLVALLEKLQQHGTPESLEEFAQGARDERETPSNRRRGRQTGAGSAARSFPGQLRAEADHFSARSLRLTGEGDRRLPGRRKHHSSGGAQVFVASSSRAHVHFRR